MGEKLGEKYDFSGDHEAQAYIVRAGFVPFEKETEMVLGVKNMSGSPFSYGSTQKTESHIRPLSPREFEDLERRRAKNGGLRELAIGATG